MAKKRKVSGKAGAVELSEEQLDQASGGIAIIAGGDEVSQKVQKVHDLSNKPRLPEGSIRANR